MKTIKKMAHAFFIFILLFFSLKVFAVKNNGSLTFDPTKETSLQLDMSEKELLKIRKENMFSIYLESEGRLFKDFISINQKNLLPSAPYTELGFYYAKADTLQLFINGEIKSKQNEWQIGLEELSLSYMFDDIPLNLKAGYVPLPLGYMNENKNVFSNRLSFYDILTQQAEDIGWMADLHIWKDHLILRGGQFGGFLKRRSDAPYEAPDSTPFIIMARAQGSAWSAFFSYFEKDLAFFDPLQAFGTGTQLQWSYKKLTVRLQSESWLMMEKGQSTFAYYVFPRLSIYKLTVGGSIGGMNQFTPDLHTTEVESALYERVFQVSYEAHRNVTIIGERFISTQKGGPAIKDSWALRVKMNFDWSYGIIANN